MYQALLWLLLAFPQALRSVQASRTTTPGFRQVLLQVSFSQCNSDALVTRQACIALTQLSTMPDRPAHSSMQPVYKALTDMLLSNNLPSSTWYTAAEAAITAIYALHPAPQELTQAIIGKLGRAALHNSQPDSAVTGAASSTSNCCVL